MGKNSTDYAQWEKVKDYIDQYIDLMINYRQSGHPGGSRSKVHAFVTLLLGGSMRWDIRHPEKRYGDRFVLAAGHTVPLVYATLAVFNEAMRQKYLATGDLRYNPGDDDRVLYPQDLLGFRRKDGLSGHAEMSGKTMFLKFNTGPSGHGLAAAAGEAVALKRAKAYGVKVFAIEGEGGLTTGVTHEVANSAYGLALDNLNLIVDWNDYGIDNHRTSSIVYGSPYDWFSSHGWNTIDGGMGDDFANLDAAFAQISDQVNDERVPNMLWFTSRKGRGYLKYDNDSHGAPHKMNSEVFWQTKAEFMEKYKVTFKNAFKDAPNDSQAQQEEFKENLEILSRALSADTELIDYLADRLVELGDSVPDDIPSALCNAEKSPFTDPVLFDAKQYPTDLYLQPGEKAANRSALAKWGSWINAYSHKKYGRPLFLASSADLSSSTNISGFAEAYGDFPGYGWYERVGSHDGALLPQGITEFANAGLMVGTASVNFSKHPEREFDGFWSAASTYGSFSYLVYGMLRLYSQLEQDSAYKVGKVLYVAGHTGPETADDSRTHFGIFSPGVTQLFPEGSVINLYPWEYNEVPVLLAAAMEKERPAIVVLHLTRPAVQIPDRSSLGIASHFEAAKGAYLVRDHHKDEPKMGTFYVQGTSAMANLIKVLPSVDEQKFNVKIVYVASPQLFKMQDTRYQDSLVTDYDRANSTVITTSAKKLMGDFIFNEKSLPYAISPDWDDRWRTGGNLDEVLEEAHLSAKWILQGIKDFAAVCKN